MARKPQIDALGEFLLILCSGLMGINQTLVKIVNGGLQPVFQAGLRSACALLPVFLFAVLTRKKLSISDGSFWPGILVGLLFSAEFLLVFQAVEYTTVSRASIFFYTMPFWTAVFAHFLIPGERLTLLRILGLLLAVTGVVLALRNNPGPISNQSHIGDLYCLIAGALWASIVIVARTTKLSTSSPEMQLLYQLTVSSIVLLFLAPLFGDLVRELNTTVILLFSIQVLVVVSFGFLTWFWVLSVYPASAMASFSFLSPVFGVIFGWLILDENMEGSILIALALVSVGVVLVNQKPNQPKRD